MRPLVEYPDAEFEVAKYLRGLLSVPVYTQVPGERPEEFVTLRRLGGGSDSLITERPRIDFRCWGPTKERASDLSRRVSAHIRGMRGRLKDPTVYRVSDVGGTQWLPDSNSGQPCYAQAFEIRFRGRAL